MILNLVTKVKNIQSSFPQKNYFLKDNEAQK